MCAFQDLAILIRTKSYTFIQQCQVLFTTEEGYSYVNARVTLTFFLQLDPQFLTQTRHMNTMMIEIVRGMDYFYIICRKIKINVQTKGVF